MEDINNMLNSGEVPNLFEKDELEQVLAAVRSKAKEAGFSEENRDEVQPITNAYCQKHPSSTVHLQHVQVMDYVPDYHLVRHNNTKGPFGEM